MHTLEAHALAQFPSDASNSHFYTPEARHLLCRFLCCTARSLLGRERHDTTHLLDIMFLRLIVQRKDFEGVQRERFLKRIGLENIDEGYQDITVHCCRITRAVCCCNFEGVL